MVKQPASKNGTSRIRFIMLEAEIPEGDLSQITTAIQNALKPTTTVIERRLSAHSTPAVLSDIQIDQLDSAEEVNDAAETVVAETVIARRVRDARPRKSTVPNVGSVFRRLCRNACA